MGTAKDVIALMAPLVALSPKKRALASKPSRTIKKVKGKAAVTLTKKKSIPIAKLKGIVIGSFVVPAVLAPGPEKGCWSLG